MAETFKQQRLLDRDEASVVIYGLSGRDDNDVARTQRILEYIGYNGPVIRVHRMGRLSSAAPTNSKPNKTKTRPVKVQLESKADCQYVLSQARWLRENPAMANIYISQLLSREEIERVKALRRHCESLKKSAVSDKKGRKRFVVLSGKLMFRADSGKLEPYYDKTANSSTLISSDVGTKVNLATETKN